MKFLRTGGVPRDAESWVFEGFGADLPESISGLMPPRCFLRLCLSCFWEATQFEDSVACSLWEASANGQPMNGSFFVVSRSSAEVGQGGA